MESRPMEEYPQVFSNKISELKNHMERRNRGVAIVICLVITCILLLSFGGIVMLVIGANCLSNNEYDHCGTRNGAIALVVIGCILVWCCCFSKSIWKKRNN